MAFPAEKELHSFADYLTLGEDERIEIIQGEAVMMAPPGRVHQEVSGELFAQLHSFLKGKNCKVYAAPFGVRLFQQEGDRPEDVDTVVEPDLSVVCDPEKLDDRGCKGAPDLVIEIASPSSQRYDRVTKRKLYEQAGVREYWIVTPETRSVEVLLLENGRLNTQELYSQKEIAKVTVLEGCEIELESVFAE